MSFKSSERPNPPKEKDICCKSYITKFFTVFTYLFWSFTHSLFESGQAMVFFYPEGCWPKNCNSIWEKCPQGYDFLQRVSKEVSSKLGLVFWANFNICFMLVAGFELFYWCFCLWTPFCWVAFRNFNQWFLSKMFLLKVTENSRYVEIYQNTRPTE